MIFSWDCLLAIISTFRSASKPFLSKRIYAYMDVLRIKSLIKGARPQQARLFFFRDQQRRPPSIVLGCSDSHASGTLPLLGLRKCRNRFVTNHLRIRWDLHCANGRISVIQQEGYLPKRWLFPKIWILTFFYKSYLKWRKKNWSFTQWSPLK